MSRAIVMEGSLEEFDLMSVVQTVSIGRQFTGIELLDEAGSIVGTLFLKAGQIVSASADNGLSGFDAVRRLLKTRKPRRFYVYRSKLLDEKVRPVGSVGEIMMRIVESDHSQAAAEDSLLMEGSLRDHDLGTVLEVVSLGRQCVGIDLFNREGKQAGALCVKGGQVLFALCGRSTGASAMTSLLGAQEGRFVAYRTRMAGGSDSLGSVSGFIARVRMERQRDAARATSALDADEDTETSYTQVRAPTQQLGKTSSLPPVSKDVADVLARISNTHEPLRGRPSSVPRSTWSSVTPEPMRPPAPPRAASVLRAPIVVPAEGTPVVCVTSPKGGAGKTTVALNLAVVLARRGLSVVLVDADSNGLLSAVRAGGLAPQGLTDVLDGAARLDQVALVTRVPGLCIVASGQGELEPDNAARLDEVLSTLRERADLVLVDCPPSVYGATRAVAAAATHALIVVSADPAACRAVAAHEEALRALGSLSVAGIVLNMLDYRARPSLHVFEELCASPAGPLVLEVPIPRSALLMEASARGVPVAAFDLTRASGLAWTFELLATLLLERLGRLVPELPTQSVI